MSQGALVGFMCRKSNLLFLHYSQQGKILYFDITLLFLKGKHSFQIAEKRFLLSYH